MVKFRKRHRRRKGPVAEVAEFGQDHHRSVKDLDEDPVRLEEWKLEEVKLTETSGPLDRPDIERRQSIRRYYKVSGDTHSCVGHLADPLRLNVEEGNDLVGMLFQKSREVEEFVVGHRVAENYSQAHPRGEVVRM